MTQKKEKNTVNADSVFTDKSRKRTHPTCSFLMIVHVQKNNLVDKKTSQYKETYECFGSYSCSYCLDVFKVVAVLLKVDWFLVEEPLESHIQRRVMCRFAAQHHTLPHGHFHSARA